MNILEFGKKKATLIRAYKEVFASEQGKLILDDLMMETGFTSPVMADTDRETFFNEGKRNMFLYIIHKTNLDPDKLLKRIAEGQSTGDNE